MADQRVSTTQSFILAPPTLHSFTPPATSGVHVEMPTPAYYPPGIATHKFAGTVFHYGLPIALEGHDHGNYIPHANAPPWPPNPLLLLIIPFSSRKMMFSASTVKMNGTPAGCNNLWPPTPGFLCGDPCGMPYKFPVNNLGNTALVGMTGGDYLAGCITIGATMAIDIATGGGPTKYADELAGKLGIPTGLDWVKKTGVGIATGLIKIALTGEGSFDIGVGSDKGGLKVSVKRKKRGDDGKEHGPFDGWEVESERSVGGDKHTRKVGDNSEQSWTESEWDLDGSGYTEEKKRKKYPDGSYTETITETEYDAYGRQTSRTVTVNKYDKGGRLIESESPYGEVKGKGDPTSDSVHPPGKKPL